MKVPIVTEVPVPDIQHPSPKFDMLPKHEFTMGFIAPKGQGKTTTIINLLEFYKGMFHNIIVFSPTVSSDEKWDYIKKIPLLIENLPLKNWIKQKTDTSDKNSIVERLGPAHEFEGLVADRDPNFDGLIPEDCFFEDYDESILKNIYEDQMKIVKLLKKHGKTKHLANRILLVFDDLVGSTLFNNARQNVFKGFNTRHRHYSCSMLMVSQGYREIPKTVRTNFTCLILFEICSEAELEVIAEEYPMGIRKAFNKSAKDLWHDMYLYAISEPYSFLYYNMQEKDKQKRCMKKFEEYLYFSID